MFLPLFTRLCFMRYARGAFAVAARHEHAHAVFMRRAATCLACHLADITNISIVTESIGHHIVAGAKHTIEISH